MSTTTVSEKLLESSQISPITIKTKTAKQYCCFYSRAQKNDFGIETRSHLVDLQLQTKDIIASALNTTIGGEGFSKYGDNGNPEIFALVTTTSGTTNVLVDNPAKFLKGVLSFLVLDPNEYEPRLFWAIFGTITSNASFFNVRQILVNARSINGKLETYDPNIHASPMPESIYDELCEDLPDDDEVNDRPADDLENPLLIAAMNLCLSMDHFGGKDEPGNMRHLINCSVSHLQNNDNLFIGKCYYATTLSSVDWFFTGYKNKHYKPVSPLRIDVKICLLTQSRAIT